MNILDHFQKYFSIKRCITEEEILECYRLRYRVFVEEFKYEVENPFLLEKDDFDKKATHYIVIHRETKLAAGTVRFIESSPDDNLIPYCIQMFDNENLMDTFEVSRFSISPLFRRRLNEQVSEIGSCIFTEEDIRSHPLILLGLISAVYHHRNFKNYNSFHAIMQERLIRLLKLYGIEWTEKLAPVQYHGLRIPCYVTFKQFIDSMKPSLLDFVENIQYD